MPYVTEYYDEHKDDGNIEFLTVSLDSERSEDELKTVAKEKMPWPIIFDGGGWDAKVAGLFDIHSIPQMMLIGPDGRILLTDLRHDSFGDIGKVIKAGPSFKPMSIKLEPVGKSGGEYRVKIEVDNQGSAKYEISVVYTLATEGKDGRLRWDQKEYALTLKSTGKKYSNTVLLPIGSDTSAVDIDVVVYNSFLGRDVKSRLKTRI